MITNKLYGHILCYSYYKYNQLTDLKPYIESDLFKNICKNLSNKTIIILGGDGSMLKAIKKYYDFNLPFLGINFGHKGFLLNKKNYIKENSTYLEILYPLMQVNIFVKGKEYTDVFFNELNITAGGGKMLDLNISLNKNKINIKGDGIIISTPAGSTGYNSSLRGPIIPHTIKALTITSKAPWIPRGQHPIIIKDTEKIQITRGGRPTILECYSDSREVYSGSEENIEINIEKKSTKICFLIDSNYKDIWENKVFIEQGFE